MAGVDVIALSERRPLLTLTVLFSLWKAVLVLITCISPGIGYDTSSDLLEWSGGGRVWSKWVRWDAVYFTQMARNGHVYEQQWAFGIGISTILLRFSQFLFHCDNPTHEQVTITGLLLSHFSSWISMLLVWQIARRLVKGNKQGNSKICFLAALLYIISPAGIFLSAPYTESIFAAFNMLAYLLFLDGRRHHGKGQSHSAAALTIGSGLSAGLATLMRSNGILSGMLFAWDALQSLRSLLTTDRSPSQLLRLLCLSIAGVSTGFGFVLPQYLAYREYCMQETSEPLRPWCSATIPSIFTFAQSHYWNVGLFRYWTLSNIPLFLLAAPTLMILIWSGSSNITRILKQGSKANSMLSSESAYLAVPQLILALLAISSYHVQIITRIASGYPFWYIWLAAERRVSPKLVARWMMLYALIQGGLYASFLPPA